MKTKIILLLLVGFFSCQDEPATTPSGGNSGNNNSTPDEPANWLIPEDEIFDGGTGKDGIVALENPAMLSAEDADYLDDEDLIIGFKDGTDVKAYPHNILDWHEIINDKVGSKNIAITYCPLTGTGIGWDRNLEGQLTTFGVSGLLFNANLIAYDRLTDSNWSQMLLECVNGKLIDTAATTYPMIETTWKTWKTLYPDSEVVSDQTGFLRDYQRYPYGDYKTNHDNILFSFDPMDTRLPFKERVHGIILNGQAKVYRFVFFEEGTKIFPDSFFDRDLVIIGDEKRNFIISFYNPEGKIFASHEDSGESIFKDESGNLYNFFGEVIIGPEQGKKLEATRSFMGYWFAWGAFYPQAQIF